MRRHLILAVLLCATLVGSPPLAARPAATAAAVADSARSPRNRELDVNRLPAQVLDFTQVKRGETVIDFFAGGGYWSELFLRVVGTKGTVYATDPPSFHDPKAWEPLLAGHANVRVLLTPVAQGKFAPGSADLLFTSLNYHDLYWESEKYQYPRLDVPQVLADWFVAVKPGGRVVIVDHAGAPGDPRETAEKFHRIDPERVKADMAAAGFVFEASDSMLHRSEDHHDKSVFDPSLRGHTDRFILRFRRP